LWSVTRTKGPLAKFFSRVATQYLDAFHDFSYDFEKNGEFGLLRMLSKHDFRVVLDVGANVGDWAKKASSFFPSAQFHCFELSQKTFETLKNNLQSDCYHLNNFGLGSFDGTIEYKDYGDGSGVNTIITTTTFHDETSEGKMVTSNIRTGAGYCKDKGIDRIDFLKIDVEGAENLVLEGFAGLLQGQRIRCIQFEYGFANGDAHFLMKDFFDFFERFGYVVGKIWQNGVTFSPFNYELNNFHSGPNFCAVAKSDRELITYLENNPDR
jgi:FkbM family methyltransferase